MASTTYILTEYPIDLPVRSLMPATKDFMRWRPETKTRGDESTAMGCRGHRMERDNADAQSTRMG